MRESLDGGAVAIRLGRTVRPKHALRAEVLHEQETLRDAAGVDLGHRQADRAEPGVDRHEGAHVAGAMPGARVAHRRLARLPVHQHRRAAGAADALVAARRGVALQMPARRVPPAGRIEKRPDCEAPPQAGRERAGRGQARPASIADEGEDKVEPRRRQPLPGAFGPFDQDGALGEGIVEADLVELARIGEAIEVEMRYGQPAGGIGLHEREGRARHLQPGIVGKRPDQRPREGRLAGAERPGERDEVAGLQRRGDVLGERHGRRLVGEVDGEGEGRLRRSRRNRPLKKDDQEVCIAGTEVVSYRIRSRVGPLDLERDDSSLRRSFANSLPSW